jgi:hypothetical protein
MDPLLSRLESAVARLEALSGKPTVTSAPPPVNEPPTVQTLGNVSLDRVTDTANLIGGLVAEQVLSSVCLTSFKRPKNSLQLTLYSSLWFLKPVSVRSLLQISFNKG